MINIVVVHITTVLLYYTILSLIFHIVIHHVIPIQEEEIIIRPHQINQKTFRDYI